MNKRSSKKITLIIVLLIGIIWIFWSNTALELNTYTIESNRLPEEFDGFRIAQISDLHNVEMGKNNQRLIEKLKTAKPDLIVITGDLIDSGNTDMEIALNFAKESMKIAPCYYITGNHEAWISKNEYKDFENRLVQLGVIILHDKEVLLERNASLVSLIGIDDPNFSNDNGSSVGISMLPEDIRNLVSTDSFTILLSHRPEYFSQYVSADFDLVFSGHAHGGQFRLPFIGGLVAPNQGLFPEYDAGMFKEDNTNMIVSRGIGNSIIPLRFNNRPEIVLVELRTKK